MLCCAFLFIRSMKRCFDRRKVMIKLLKVLCIAIAAALLCGVAGCAPQASGTFYTLEEAYEAGFLTRDDLMSIAYYHNGGREHNESIMDEEYAPKPRVPQELSEEMSSKIRNTAAYDYRNDEFMNAPEAVADDFQIIEYCGTYNDCVAIMMTDNYTGYTGALRTDVIAEISFSYNDGNEIKIWRENQ